MLPSPEERRDIRRKAGYSQAEAAEKLGVSSRTIHRWEYGLSHPQTRNHRNYKALLEEWQAQ